MNFSSTWEQIQSIDGWLSKGQAQALFQAAEATTGGSIVEIGSHHGRSTIVLASAAPASEVVAIDPFDSARWGGGEDAYPAFRGNLARAGVDVRLLRTTSGEAAREWDGPIGLLFVDGAHTTAAARQDLVDWEPHVLKGGRVFVHDTFSARGVTRAVLERHLFNRNWRYRGSTRTLACFERRSASAAETALDSLRLISMLLYFARNTAIKVALRWGPRFLPRLLGHREPVDPY
jgi:predicted O-methyltransferase YrrM